MSASEINSVSRVGVKIIRLAPVSVMSGRGDYRPEIACVADTRPIPMHLLA